MQPERVILFGSAARGEMTAKSDFDLLVIIKPRAGEHDDVPAPPPRPTTAVSNKSREPSPGDKNRQKNPERR